MKYILFLLLTLPLLAIAQSDKDFQQLVENETHNHQHMLDYRSNELTADYDIKYHRLEWEVNPEIFYIKGAVTTYFQPLNDDFLSIYFDFSNALSIDSVLFHGNALSFNQAGGDVLQIEFGSPLPAAVLDSITVYYQGEPPTTGFGSYRQTFHEGTPLISTLSEPYGAKDWWPCKQDLNDKIDSIDVFVKTPESYRVASNGLLVSEVQDGANKVFHWQHRYPIPAYLVAIGVTDYAVYSDFVPTVNGEIEVLNYVYPEDSVYIRSQTQATVEVMQLFNELFGIYPFADEKYGHAQFGFGGGMEHQTMSFMGGWSHLLQAHELAHQWFGDKVTCGSWEDIWLNEGFATYLEGMSYEYGLGPNTWENWKGSKIDNVTSQPGGSVWVDDTTSVARIFNGRLTYSKGAMLLHMLRWKLGDEDFFQGVRNYLNAPGIAYGYALTDDLKFHLEEQSGQDLTEFFTDWFYGQGFPIYQVEWWQDMDLTVHVVLNQSTSHPSVDFFEMPVPIQFSGAADSLFVFEHEITGQVFSAQPGYEVEELIFDPDLWLLAQNELIVASSEEAYQPLLLNIYPNPSNGVLNIEISKSKRVEYIEILTLDGRVVKKIGSFQNGFVEIPTSHLSNGMYFLKVKSKDNSEIFKFINHVPK